MSTSAAAIAREPDDRPRTNRWLKYIGEEDGSPSGNTIPIEHPTTETLPFDFARVERLVGQLEARSLALVKYRYVEPPQTSGPSSNSIVIISALLGLWISTVILTVAYIHFNFLTPPQSANQDRAATKRVVSTVPNPEAQKLASPVDQAAKSLNYSSPRRKVFEAAVSHSKGPQKPRGAAVQHHASDGTVDYWLLPGLYDDSPTKVFSVGKAANGVVVRNLEDGHYYVVTPSGSWHRISVPSSK